MADLQITSLRGGMNDTDPPSALANDQCVEAVNVEFNRSTLGERRRGATDVTITVQGGAPFDARDKVVHLHRHLPSEDESEAELWAVGVESDLSAVTIFRKGPFGWEPLVIAADAPTTGIPLFKFASQSIHGKVFMAYQSAQDRLHVMDSGGTDGTIRRVGIVEPTTAPTGADTGAPGTVYAGIRYVRIRWLFSTGGAAGIRVRSEPSPVLTFTPSGANTTMRVTQPTVPSDESITHWDVELSLDNVNFYRSSASTALAIASTTYDDTTAYTTGYASGTLSEDVGDYTVPHSPKYLAADEDRLVIAGSWEQPALSSRVSWTTVFGEPGVGNDERIPLDTDNFIDLDTYEGGEITGISDSTNGVFYTFKISHTYRFIRTGQRTRAYDVVLLSKERGAIPGSVVEGVDQTGHPCVYFLDPSVGPCLIGQNGLQTCGGDVQTKWRTVNLSAAHVVCHGVYYADTRQVHWWISVDDDDTPSLRLVLQTNLQRTTDEGVRRGWALATGPSAVAYASCMFSSDIEGGVIATAVYRNRILRPFLGQGTSAAVISRLDETVDTDSGTAYFARIVTKPYAIAGILNRFGVMASALLAKVSSGVTVYVRAIKNYGIETLTKSALLTAEGSETHVIKALDDLSFSDLRAVQFQLGDDPAEVVTPVGAWELNELSLKLRKEESA